MTKRLENQVAAKKFLAGLRTRDWAGMRAIMAEDVFWTMPGNGAISGKAEGVDAVVGKAQTIVRSGMTFTVTHTLIGQEGPALSPHNIARRADAVFDQDLVNVLRLERGIVQGAHNLRSATNRHHRR